MVDREVSDVRVFAVGSDGNDANRALVDEGQVRRPSLTAGTYVALRQDDERDWLVVCDERDLVGPNLDRKCPPPVRLIDLSQLQHDAVLAEPS